MQDKFVLICPIYNCWEMTKKFLDSLINEADIKYTYSAIFIDNGSTEPITQNLVDYFKHKTLVQVNGHENKIDIKGSWGVPDITDTHIPETVTVIQNPKNFGVASAWNQGLRWAERDPKIEYFLIINNDIFFRPNAINKMFEKIQETGWGVMSARDYGDKYLEVELKDELWEQVCWSCFFLSVKALRAVGYFDQEFFCRNEDRDFHHRLNLAQIGKGTILSSAINHIGNGTAKNLTEADPLKDFNWAGEMGRGNQYFSNKWGF